MFEKVNPDHPDKIADRIAGALVDLAYGKQENPRIAVEVLLGHGRCHVIAETSVPLMLDEVVEVVQRIAGEVIVTYRETEQDLILAENQEAEIRCGDNGIFKGMPITAEQRSLSRIAKNIYDNFCSDGKYILHQEEDRLIICQSYATNEKLKELYPHATINPLGYWTGGSDVDAGATNRKLGSDMGDAVTGGGLHGKDLSKADVSVNIWAHLKAYETGRPFEACCAIGDQTVTGIPYSEIVEIARKYIQLRGGFEKFAEWGLITHDQTVEETLTGAEK